MTGASSGIGLSAAVACAAAGHQVVATLRNLDRRSALEAAAKAQGVQVDVEQLDVTATDVPERIRELVLKYGPFTGLVNNAGVAVGGAFEEQSEEDVRLQFETNVFGLMAVTRAVLPSMRAARRGRIINVSSVSGLVGLPGVSVYAATKHAVEGFSEALRWELAGFGVEVCLLEPGTFKTPIYGENQRRASQPLPDRAYQALTAAVERIILGEAAKAPPPDVVAKAVVKLLGADAPPFRTLIGRDARALVTLRRVVPDRLFALGVRQKLGVHDVDPDRSR
ncbi:putative short-chain oxidoreductase [Chondromyces apiculatus DSM 436]|uniref:Putative short-chain oxidoreductase n=1 Tax=Chondromyces apiculatus DSM 436 TaxID=1192034 RepID=A0A017SWD9_9BACT|nr:putative short-chain oxidoreductase [Chondromyces apiculatus DSM 436]